MKRKNWLPILLILISISLMMYGSGLSDNISEQSVVTGTSTEVKSGTVTITREEYDRLQRFSQMDKILQYIEDYYYQEPNVDKMVEMATRGLLYGLEDQYTFFYSSSEWSDMLEEDKGEYAGIGVQMIGSDKDLTVTITRVFKNSPAEAAGLKKGDVFAIVEDIEVTAYTMQNAVNIMRGTPGESVHVEVYRGVELLSFDIVRAKIRVNRVESVMLDQNVGYIILYEFAGDCAEAFSKALTDIKAKGATSLIVDLRDNPGGWVNDGVSIADLFLDEQLLVYSEDRYGNQEKTYTKAGSDIIPLVLLINENSASTSEIVSGALQDYKRATVVGVTSFGKGVIQYVLPLDDNNTENTAGFQFTYAQYYTPLGNKVHGIGIKPDIAAEMPEDLINEYFELGDLSDPQLLAAYETAISLSSNSASTKK